MNKTTAEVAAPKKRFGLFAARPAEDPEIRHKPLRQRLAENWQLYLLLLDGESAELFINDGERALSALLETPPDAQDITFRSDGPVKLDILHHTLG